MILRLCVIVILGLAKICLAEDIDWHQSPEIEKTFKEAGVRGTFVLYDQQDNTYTGHNLARAQQRYIPASTFKIANTLIGLSTGSVKNVDEVLPYGGKPQVFRSWEKDMSLREAIKISNVPIYQELARRTGPGRMQEHLQKLAYGNRKIGTQVDNFWLEGPLKISAIEQAEFLSRLSQNQLPYAPADQHSVKEILLLESSVNHKLYGKTGWTNASTPGIGWSVGWVEKDGRVYSFALNVDINEGADAQKRIPLGRKSLVVLGVL